MLSSIVSDHRQRREITSLLMALIDLEERIKILETEVSTLQLSQEDNTDD